MKIKNQNGLAILGKERKLHLHKGLLFVSSSGKCIIERQIQPLKKCRKTCQTILTDDVRYTT